MRHVYTTLVVKGLVNPLMPVLTYIKLEDCHFKSPVDKYVYTKKNYVNKLYIIFCIFK